MRPSQAVGRLLMALNFQAFIDDSYSNEEFVLGGYIAPAGTWAKFALAWEEVLPCGTKTKDGRYHFKMSEMNRTQAGRDRVRVFYNIIDEYDDLIPISCRMNLGDLRRAHERLLALCLQWNWTPNLGPWNNRYFFMFHQLIEGFHDNREAFKADIALDELVDFIFDQQSEEALLPPWNEFILSRPDEVQQFYGAKPRFDSDQKLLPLQAADLWAWWVREWYEEDASDLPDKLKALDFGQWKGKKRPRYSLSTNRR